MGSKDFLEKCKKIVVDYFNSRADKTDKKQIAEDDVFVVWYCKSCRITRYYLVRLFQTVCIMRLPTTVTNRKPMWTHIRNGRISL